MGNHLTAVGVETGLWNKIIKHLIDDGWKIRYKYDFFDAGIDFDLIVIEKNEEQILFGWDNWCEGEIQCSTDKLKELSIKFDYAFELGEPGNLKPEVVSIFWNG